MKFYYDTTQMLVIYIKMVTSKNIRLTRKSSYHQYKHREKMQNIKKIGHKLKATDIPPLSKYHKEENVSCVNMKSDFSTEIVNDECRDILD